MSELAQLHVVQVVDLRDSHRKPLLVAKTYGRIGMDYHHVPTCENVRFTLPHFESIMDIVKTRPTLIHCWKGVHRTGTFQALYRIHRQGWSCEDARQELVTNGFGSIDNHLELWGSVC